MTATLRVFVDGRAIDVVSGSSVAAAVAHTTLAFGKRGDGSVRAPLCGMGICFECRVRIDGVDHLRACMTEVRADMRIDTAQAPRDG